MASVVITINTDGAAFHAPDYSDPAYEVGTPAKEVARILEVIARDFTVYGVRPRLAHDFNDNPCGKVEVIE